MGERLLYDAGAIAELGSVDAGTTQTDTLALERQRGITIRAAVASFTLGKVAWLRGLASVRIGDSSSPSRTR